MTPLQTESTLEDMESSGSGAPPPPFRLAEWIVDPSACHVTNGRDGVRLRPLLTDLLVLLAERPGEVVAKEEILDRLWAGRIVSDSILTRTMAELRRVLGDDVGRPRIIETIPKRGYKLIAAVAAVQTDVPRRIAVLDFENLNRDPEYDYFASGMADAITTELARLGGLHVISRFSTVAISPQNATLDEIARRLRVDAVLEGSALHAGSTVRVNAQLILAAPERHLWAETYICELKDVLQVQGSVAQAVAQAVRAALTPAEAARLSHPREVTPEAHLAYLKARYHILRWTPEGLDKGYRFIQQAMAADPTYAPAYALLAHAFSVLGYWGHMPVEAAYPRAKQAAARAVELDPSDGESHAVLGGMYWLLDWNTVACAEEMRLATSLAPSSTLVHLMNGLFLSVSGGEGGRARARELASQTLDLDPLSMGTNFSAGWLSFFCGDMEVAKARALTTLDMYPECIHAHYLAGWTALAGERHEDAAAAFRHAVDLSPDAVSLSYLGTALARGGETGAARAILEGLAARRERGEVVPEFFAALVHASVGDTGAALDIFEACLAKRDSWLFWLGVPVIAGLLSGEARFQDLMARVEDAIREAGSRPPARPRAPEPESPG